MALVCGPGSRKHSPLPQSGLPLFAACADQGLQVSCRWVGGGKGWRGGARGPMMQPAATPLEPGGGGSIHLPRKV
jgi:hypothetical protein